MFPATTHRAWNFHYVRGGTFKCPAVDNTHTHTQQQQDSTTQDIYTQPRRENNPTSWRAKTFCCDIPQEWRKERKKKWITNHLSGQIVPSLSLLLPGSMWTYTNVGSNAQQIIPTCMAAYFLLDWFLCVQRHRGLTVQSQYFISGGRQEKKKTGGKVIG